MRMMIDVRSALELIEGCNITTPTCEEVFISDTIGRTACENIVSPVDFPAFTRSAMDGYALVGSANSTQFALVNSASELKDGTCIRVNTGFPIPKHAFAVVELEKTTLKNGIVILEKPVEKKRNFTEKASEIRKGEILIEKGTLIDEKLRSLLAYVGLSSVKVFRKPVVGIVTTGDEVVFPGKSTEENVVYNCNYFILEGLLKKWGAQPVYFGHIPDEKEIFVKTVKNAIERCDFLITTGGVSKGSRDYTREVLKTIGCEFIFENTTIKPGKPALLAKLGDKYIFGAPGWPSALYTVAVVYVKPLTLRFCGNREYKHRFNTGVLKHDMHANKKKDYFNRVIVTMENGTYMLESSGSQKTDTFLSVARASGLVWIEKGKGDVPAGSKLPFIFI